MRCFLPEESVDTGRVLMTLGGWSHSTIVPVPNISLIKFSSSSKLFIANLLLLDLAVSGSYKNGSLYLSCIIFKSVSFELIVFFQKLWFCFNFPLTDIHFSWFVNSISLILRFCKLSVSSVLLSRDCYRKNYVRFYLLNKSILFCCWTFR